MHVKRYQIKGSHLLSVKHRPGRIGVFKQPATARKMAFQDWFFIVIFLLGFPCLAFAQPLTIITDPYPPLGYVNKDGEIVGSTVDIIRLLLKRTGIDGKFVMYPWARAYEMAQNKKDILIYQLTYSKERERLFQLVGPILSSREYLFKLKERKDVAVNDLEDAKRYLVGTVRDYFAHRYLLENGFEEGKNLEVVHDDDINLKKLVSSRIDLMVLTEYTFYYRVKEAGYDRDDFEKALLVYSEDAYIAFSRQTSPDVVSRIAKALVAIKMDGSYDRIMEKWGVPTPTKGKE